MRTLHAFLALLRQAPTGAVVNLSSDLGSHAVARDLDRIESGLQMPGYTTSKAALNMLTTQWAAALPEVRINSVDPGHTATDNDHSGPQTVEEGAEIIVAMATIDSDGPTGTSQTVAALSAGEHPLTPPRPSSKPSKKRNRI